jgi:hypothetical protein
VAGAAGSHILPHTPVQTNRLLLVASKSPPVVIFVINMETFQKTNFHAVLWHNYAIWQFTRTKASE